MCVAHAVRPKAVGEQVHAGSSVLHAVSHCLNLSIGQNCTILMCLSLVIK